MNKSKIYIETLNLLSHPEGGFYAETYECPMTYTAPKGNRPLSTSIYFLLENSNVSHFHQLDADEMWYFHDGAPLDVYMIMPDGKLVIETLGLNLLDGERPQILVPAGAIFGSCLNAPANGAFSLVGCMVSYGFHFEDFKLFSREELLNLYPMHEEAIVKLTQASY